LLLSLMTIRRECPSSRVMRTTAISPRASVADPSSGWPQPWIDHSSAGSAPLDMVREGVLGQASRASLLRPSYSGPIRGSPTQGGRWIRAKCSL
jgi:hypothetical protein